MDIPVRPVPLTQLIAAWRTGDGAAFESLLEATLDDLRAIAGARLGEQPGTPTWTPQELVHETVLRMLERAPAATNRLHFFATVSLMMRSILVDHARARIAAKRGGGAVAVTLTDSLEQAGSEVVDVLAIDQALDSLAHRDGRSADVLHLSCFAGLAQEEIAEFLQVSTRTVERDLRFARAWVQAALEDA